MKQFKGTRGTDWFIQSEPEGIHTIWMEETPDDIPTLIARTCYAIDSEANSQLIAASPDLLEALQILLEAYEDDGTKDFYNIDPVQLAKSAINKALGE